MVSATNSPLRFEELADRKLAIFSDALFGNGCGEASTMFARQLATQRDEEGLDDAFAVVNLDMVVERYRQWHSLLPFVKPFYAVKCNNDPILLNLLANLGCGFDCASRGEIEAVVGSAVATGENIIYANPCKTRSYIRHAQKMGVRRMTFDSAEELHKINEMHSNPQLILRIAIADPSAQCPLATKFGCDLEAAFQLTKMAFNLGMELIGISFHVGSGCRDPTAFRLAIAASSKLFEFGTFVGHRMTLLDIGGGFPGSDSPQITFSEIVSVIRHSLDDYFPLNNDVGNCLEIIAEPGRFFASSPVSLCTNVIAVNKVPASRVTKSEADDGNKGYMLYINDGVYGSFNCILFDHFRPRGFPLFEHKKGENQQPNQKISTEFPTIVWGQTCDGLDQVEAYANLRKMDVGDWLYYENMGAYTSVAASNFNGFDTPQPFYMMSETIWNTIYGTSMRQ